ncbi:MAG: hypothetical protein M3N95_06420 [Actinomycetota bacterium]|nr:hypothetical protein [Actinomycetota bacterium]
MTETPPDPATPEQGPQLPHESQAPVSQAPPPQPPFGWVPPGTTPLPDPFMPQARTPRTPWVNPARRTHVGAALLAIALIFGGAGVAIGWAASDGHGHAGSEFRMGPQNSFRGQFPQGPGPGRLRPSQLPNVPAPSTSS